MEVLYEWLKRRIFLHCESDFQAPKGGFESIDLNVSLGYVDSCHNLCTCRYAGDRDRDMSKGGRLDV